MPMESPHKDSETSMYVCVCVSVCLCVCVSVCMLFLYTGGDLNLNTHRLMGTCHGGDLN